jgi:hypothetical protein
MRRLLALLPALVALAVPSAVLAHAGNPNFRSNVTQVSPAPKGLDVNVQNYDDRLQLINHTGKTVTIFGYNNEPYAQLLPDGTVQVNKLSPAFYLNDDRYANVQVPKSANPKAAPQWSTVDKTGRFDWHDHRIHWMSTALPPQVKDKKKRTFIFDWKVPLAVAGAPTTVSGNLFYQPRPGGSAPTGAIIAMIVLVLGGGALVLVVRRRRVEEEPALAGGPSDDPPSDDKPKEKAEAW